MEIDGCFLGWKQLVVWEDVRSPMTTTNHARSLGGFDDGINKEHKEEVIGWANEDVWV